MSDMRPCYLCLRPEAYLRVQPGTFGTIALPPDVPLCMRCQLDLGLQPLAPRATVEVRG